MLIFLAIEVGLVELWLVYKKFHFW